MLKSILQIGLTLMEIRRQHLKTHILHSWWCGVRWSRDECAVEKKYKIFLDIKCISAVQREMMYTFICI